MSNTFFMTSYILENDLFINLSGVFDGSSAWELANIILARSHGFKKLFIDARNLSEVLPFGAEMIVNLVPRVLVREKNVLIRDCHGTHSGLDYFQILSEKIFPEESHHNYFSTATIC